MITLSSKNPVTDNSVYSHKKNGPSPCIVLSVGCRALPFRWKLCHLRCWSLFHSKYLPKKRLSLTLCKTRWQPLAFSCAYVDALPSPHKARLCCPGVFPSCPRSRWRLLGVCACLTCPCDALAGTLEEDSEGANKKGADWLHSPHFASSFVTRTVNCHLPDNNQQHCDLLCDSMIAGCFLDIPLGFLLLWLT